VKARYFSVKKALEILGIRPPRVRKGMSQKEINDLVAEWKETTLEEHYKKARREAHPDAPGGDEERFKNLEHAYEEVVEHLVLRKPRIPPSKITECPECHASRQPPTAAHCHNCGKKYPRDEPRTECPVCAMARVPKGAKFCHGCGYDYQVPDYFLERLMNLGVPKHELRGMEADGTLDKLRSINPMSPKFNSEVDLIRSVWKFKRRSGLI